MAVEHPDVRASSRSLLGPKELAAQLGVSLPTIYRKRSLGEGLPPAIKIGSQVRWRQETVDAWLLANEEKIA